MMLDYTILVVESADRGLVLRWVAGKQRALVASGLTVQKIDPPAVVPTMTSW